MAKTFMRVLGIILIVVGIIGFFVPFTGFLDLTVTHDLVHLVTGAIALIVSGNTQNSALWAKIFGFVYLVVAILGLFVQNVLGLIMLMPADTVLHFIIAAASLYIGFSKNASTTVTKSA